MDGPATDRAAWLQGPQLSAIALVLANLLPLAGVLFAGWQVGTIVLFFWAENLIIGLCNVIRLLANPGRGARFSALFFTVHYGGFTAGHGLFIYYLFNLGETVQPGSIAPRADSFEPALDSAAPSLLALVQDAPPLWLWGLAALAISHGGSVLLNYFLRGERQRLTVGDLMSAPYKRIVVLHVTVIIGGMLTEWLGSPIFLLVLLIALKIAIDLRAHWRSHTPLQVVGPSSATLSQDRS
ncbi:MAG: DUF6498-containing protein [Pseudomonadota bacterium]